MFKSLFLFGLFLLLLFVPLSYAGQVNAFIYHRFDESRYPSTNISADIFTQQLEYVTEQGLDIISLGEVARRLDQEEDLPVRAVSFCVDDAFRSLYDVGMPIIRKYNIPLTLFVNTAAVGTSGYMTWQELQELAAEGVEIGNHTDTHAYLVELKTNETYAQWKKRIGDDIEKSQQQFEKHLGARPTLFAYPYGEYSTAVIEIIKTLGFKIAFAQQSGVIHPEHNRYNLPRFPMGGPFATLASFKSKLSMQPMLVSKEDSFDPVIGENPPVLHLHIPGKQIVTQRFNCFVQGENRCWVEADTDRGSGWYQVLAEKPLSGRRNKYTLTLQSQGGGWLWYSHPWINAKNPVKDGE
ncbi:MAG: polysaccharide deacetylase family protein [Desulfuromusa sp.]|nr:polysaccharide deacetylase family protein [Desulfuromusa sp.]